MRSWIQAFFTGDSLKMRAMRGSMITFLGFGGTQVLRLAGNLVLTRLLVPEYFGLMTIVQVVTTAVQMFSDTGVHVSIMQSKRGDDPLFLDTAWVVQILRGALLWVIVTALSGPAAAFYDQPELAALLPVASVGLLICGFRSTKMATAGRHLALGRVTLIELSTQAICLVILALLAFWLRSVWALLIGGLVGQALNTLASHLFLPGHANRFRLERAAFGEQFNFGKFIFLSSTLGFLLNQGDRAILGKFVSMSELGIYNIGFFLATVPLMLTRQFGDRILIPLYREKPPSAGAENRVKIRKARLGLTGAMLVLSLFLAIAGDWLIRLLYTEAYHEAGPILVLLALSGMPFIISNAYTGLYLAAGRSRDLTLQLSFTAAVQMIVLYTGVKAFGLLGAAIAPAIVAMISYPVTVYFARRNKGWDPGLDGGLALAALLGAGAVMLWIHPEIVSRL
ncbi:oligosaccharide flippase family protein [Rhodovulum visakhapatnamense]|uniref:O-antigen/teichoic acid export membrane protein n=1 Tax=Rhodovulum visakhapatnamense TaxID=364297 RepID=A0A4R8F9I2_9RHOB|nr:oligosaccharide flippase family protein [Rhodovulum visakhapatnamense]TDX21872.1 O-antigen/teichoic acid export membrane protein [Rhodovulum visakhapatnamense]